MKYLKIIKRNKVAFKRLYLLPILILSCVNQNKLSSLDDYINSSLKDWDLPGLAVAVVLDDKIIYAKGFGIKEIGKNNKINKKTLFQIGSVTKGFASASIASLVDDGLVTWDDPVVKHLPWFKLKDVNVSNKITIRDLLAHTSDMPAHAYHSLEIIDELEVAKRAELLEIQSSDKKYRYSNQAYGLIGLLVESVTKKNWGDWLRKRIFEPLNMNNSFGSPYQIWDSSYVAPTFLGTAPSKNVSINNNHKLNVAMPHGKYRNTYRKVLPWQSYDNLQPAGSIVSNVVDMANWIRFHINEGKFENQQVISKNNLLEMHKPQIENIGYFLFADSTNEVKLGRAEGITSSKNYYGLGWSIGTFQREVHLSHGGGIFGFPAFISFLPEKNAGVVVLANGSLWTPYYPHHEITAYIYSKLFDLEQKDLHHIMMNKTNAIIDQVNSLYKTRNSQRNSSAKQTLPIEDYLGLYESKLAGPFEIKLEDTLLRLEFKGKGAFSGQLEHWYDNTFILYFDGGDGQAYESSLITFIIENSKNVTGVDLGSFGRYNRILLNN